MTYEELLAENLRLRARIRELEQENARLKGYGSSLLCEPEPPQYGSRPVRPEQKEAVQRLLACNNSVLAATTAFGKTVAAIGMIARRKTNTLILVHSKALLEQWKEEIEKFLIISEPERQPIRAAVIDRSLLWFGSIDLAGSHHKEEDNVMRVLAPVIASEILGYMTDMKAI